jgi:hypothetical protein
MQMAVEELLGAVFSNWFASKLHVDGQWDPDSYGCETENVAMRPVGLGTKNYCAGEDQQQFTWITNQTFASVLHESQSHEKVKYDHESHRTWSQEWLCWGTPVAIRPSQPRREEQLYDFQIRDTEECDP